MKITRLFAKESPVRQPKDQLIHDEMFFLLEPKERRFEQQLRAHLLDEGCNLPIVLAKPRFYQVMITNLAAGLTPEQQQEFTRHMGEKPEDYVLSHELFHRAMRFFLAKLQDAAPRMTEAVLESIQRLKTSWLLDENLFHEDLEHFQLRVQGIIAQLCDASQSGNPRNLPFNVARRRLYLALTTSLLSKMNVRQVFEHEFGTIPTLLDAMSQDHAVFCRFMAFSREQSPYCDYLATRTFWRTLETLRLESVREQR